MSKEIEQRPVAVLGAGVMGGQIAALLANAGFAVKLLDVAGEDGSAAPAQKGLQRALESRPAAFLSPEFADRVEPGTLADLSCLQGVGWIIEAIVEDTQAKKDLLVQIAAAAPADAVLSSNTSGLSIAGLAQALPPQRQTRFLGIHFFNPPRYMKLVEVVPGPATDPDLIAAMSGLLQQRLGKGVVCARDTPNFIANRLGVFALMDMLHRFEEQSLEVEEIDALTGPLLGRPTSATLRLCDLVGLDILLHVASTAYQHLPDDSRRPVYKAPRSVQQMVENGQLGAKTGAGFYRKDETGIQALDPATGTYRPMAKPRTELTAAAHQADLAARLQAAWDSDTWVARHLQEVLLYAAIHAGEMADDPAAVDRAMRWGFNWEAGPFEQWDLLGVAKVVARLEQSGEVVPPLVAQLLASGADSFYQPHGETRQIFVGQGRPPVVEAPPTWAQRLTPDRARWGNQSAYVADLDQGLGGLVFQGRLNVLGPQTLEVVQRLVAERPYEGVVLWGSGEHFSAGADLAHIAGLVESADWSGMEAFLIAFQAAITALQRAPFPVVAAPRGLALGGGCEYCLAADARVVGAELQMGLVEASVGLIPGGGGCKEMVRRGGAGIQPAFEVLLKGRFSQSAYQARQWGLLDPEDAIELGQDQLVERACQQVRNLLQGGYKGPADSTLRVAGDAGLAVLEEWLDRQQEQQRLSPHDRVVGQALARVLCGNGGAERSVGEGFLLELEREVFLHLCGLEGTQARIAHMLQTGKPLRN
ncbi:MAG: 3-hydroxyacyl-CoA dehydrogenase [Candidatus Latescibacteria bacterium]|nr:3-hydroxyacyl-CoA dehydrogenase [Candidatus Latescibacterota bacterium]